MDESANDWYFSGMAWDNPCMKPPAPLLVPFREVRHDQPDDCLHYESVAVRGEEMGWTIPAHRHEGLHQFQFMRSGSISGEIDGERFEAQAPALLMLTPGAVHGFTYSHDAVGHQITVPTTTLKASLGQGTLAAAGLGSSFVVSGADAQGVSGEALALFESVAREFRGVHPARVHALLAYATLVAVLFLRSRMVQPAPGRQQGARDTLVQRYRALIEQHYASHQPLSFHAAKLGVTADHLSRACRQSTGQSALELLHERLMLEARRLLAYTPIGIAEIALQLGYDDPAYFSKFFSRFVGKSPSVYRDQVARGVQDAAAPRTQ